MAISDDPFADLETGEHTIIKPTPGGYVGNPPIVNPTRSAQTPPEFIPIKLPPRQGLNRLESAASALFGLLISLKNTATPTDVDSLYRQLVKEIQLFEEKARSLGVNDQMILTRARYVLCATLDDIILNTRWGQQFGWAKKTLQGTFYRREWSGREFFELLNKLLQTPANHRELLELIYLCLALGFEGEFRIYNRQHELDERRETLYQTLRNLAAQDEAEPELSPHWRGVTDTRNPLFRYVPLWVLAAISALILVILYLTLYFHLTTVSDPVFVAFQQTGKDIPRLTVSDYIPPPPPEPDKITTIRKLPPPPPPPSPAPAHVQLRDRLQSERCVEAKELILSGQSSGTRIRTNTRCGVLFASGQWQVEPNLQALLNRITPALADTLSIAPGRVLVTGHTDSIPGRFIDNNELSQRRANAVMASLTDLLGTPSRFSAEGRAEREAIADNSTREGRALNRRVELLVLYPGVLPP